MTGVAAPATIGATPRFWGLLKVRTHLGFAPPTSGYFASFTVAGVRTYVHWSFPAAGLAIAFILGDMSLVTTVSAVVAYTLLVLVHEAGHAYFANRAGCKVHALVVTAGGGFCISEFPRRRQAQLFFLAGGLLAQLLAFAVAISLLVMLGSPTSRVTGSFAIVFTVVNAIMFFSNLIPYSNNDGARIYRVLSSRSGES